MDINIHNYSSTVSFSLDPSQVTIDIEDENDEPPVCSPRVHQAVIFDNVTVGTNIDRFMLVCHDRDSSDLAMRFEIVSGKGVFFKVCCNECSIAGHFLWKHLYLSYFSPPFLGNRNNHFSFDPARGSSTPELIVKTPFHLEAGAKSRQRYHLVVNIIDDNLYNITGTKARTGTVLIDVHVLRANPTPAPVSPAYASLQHSRKMSFLRLQRSTLAEVLLIVPHYQLASREARVPKKALPWGSIPGSQAVPHPCVPCHPCKGLQLCLA